MSKCPITRALAALKRFAGLPVPAVVQWIDGKPDFRKIDMAKIIRFYELKLCAVCGTKLTLSCYWIEGSLSAHSHFFTDGPMHKECAEESIKLCPFLNGTRQDYRGDLPHSEMQVADGRPERMYLMRSHTSEMKLSSQGLWAGKLLTKIKQF